MALVGNLRLWTVQELVSSVLLCNHKSIQDETVRKVCENFQYLDMGVFVHILSGRCVIMELCKKCIHFDVCEKKSDMDKLSDDVLQELTQPNNSAFGVSLNCDYYKKKSIFTKTNKKTKKYNGVE